MSERFEAEATLRAACSGLIPLEGQTLIRSKDGWIFGQVSSSEIIVTFEEIEGRIDDRLQLPSEIAYEDEVNTFTLRNTFTRQLTAPQFEAWVRFNRR